MVLEEERIFATSVKKFNFDWTERCTAAGSLLSELVISTEY